MVYPVPPYSPVIAFPAHDPDVTAPVSKMFEDAYKSSWKVLLPAIVCAIPVIKPVTPTPAIGILKVCVEPEEDMLNPVPADPTTKY